jgi:hypothetical protein
MTGIAGHDPELPVTFDRNDPPGFALNFHFWPKLTDFFIGEANAS